jgi:hypothetical protein
MHAESPPAANYGMKAARRQARRDDHQPYISRRIPCSEIAAVVPSNPTEEPRGKLGESGVRHKTAKSGDGTGSSGLHITNVMSRRRKA